MTIRLRRSWLGLLRESSRAGKQLDVGEWRSGKRPQSFARRLSAFRICLANSSRFLFYDPEACS